MTEEYPGEFAPDLTDGEPTPKGGPAGPMPGKRWTDAFRRADPIAGVVKGMSVTDMLDTVKKGQALVRAIQADAFDEGAAAIRDKNGKPIDGNPYRDEGR